MGVLFCKNISCYNSPKCHIFYYRTYNRLCCIYILGHIFCTLTRELYFLYDGLCGLPVLLYLTSSLHFFRLLLCLENRLVADCRGSGKASHVCIFFLFLSFSGIIPLLYFPHRSTQTFNHCCATSGRYTVSGYSFSHYVS